MCQDNISENLTHLQRRAAYYISNYLIDSWWLFFKRV